MKRLWFALWNSALWLLLICVCVFTTVFVTKMVLAFLTAENGITIGVLVFLGIAGYYYYNYDGRSNDCNEP